MQWSSMGMVMARTEGTKTDRMKTRTTIFNITILSIWSWECWRIVEHKGPATVPGEFAETMETKRVLQWIQIYEHKRECSRR